MKQLTCGSLNGMRLLAVATHTLDTGPLEGPARSRSWSLGLWSNPWARDAVDCGETDQGDVREETVVGNACGGKPAAMEARRYCRVMCRGGAITIASLSLQASIRS